MELNEQTVEAKAYARSDNGVTFVKVGFYGIYLNYINVRESPKYKDQGLWVQFPKYASRGIWRTPIERNPNGRLWKLIEKKCQDAAVSYDPQTPSQFVASSGDIILTEIPEKLDLDRIFDEAGNNL